MNICFAPRILSYELYFTLYSYKYFVSFDIRES